jgi:HK97 gp10 family phage protein
MATFKFKGLDEYTAQLESLSNQSDEYIGKAVFEGAKVVADAVKQSIGEIPVDNTVYKKDGECRAGLKSVQIEGLRDSFGISTLQEGNNDYQNVKIGFNGNNKIKSKRWPNGQPNAMVARSINSGTSFMRKYSFMDNATRSKKTDCEDAMKNSLEESIAGLTK